jgi:hypothetical protein
MDIELFTDDNWRNTKLMVDGKQEPFITRIDIFVGDKRKATIEVNKPISGIIPYGSLVTIKGTRYKADSSGKLMKTTDRAGLMREAFEYKNVNVYKVN